ncbi:MAG: hypothetical protein QM723_05235 [Myxococcaceae bacterium]
MWDARAKLAAVLMMAGGLLFCFGGCGGALAWYHYGTDAALPLTEVTVDGLMQTRPDRWAPHYRVELTVGDDRGGPLHRSSYDEDARNLAGVAENSDLVLLSREPLPSGRQQLIVHRYDGLLVGCESAFERLGTTRESHQAFVVGDRRAAWAEEAQRAGRTSALGLPLGAMMFFAGVMLLRTRRRPVAAANPAG